MKVGLGFQGFLSPGAVIRVSGAELVVDRANVWGFGVWSFGFRGRVYV